MKQLNMAIYTGMDEGKADSNKVTLTAAFANHEDAVAFHEDLAELCNQHSMPKKNGGWFKQARDRAT